MTRQSLQAFKADFFRALAHPVRIRILEACLALRRSQLQGQNADRS